MGVCWSQHHLLYACRPLGTVIRASPNSSYPASTRGDLPACRPLTLSQAAVRHSLACLVLYFVLCSLFCVVLCFFRLVMLCCVVLCCVVLCCVSFVLLCCVVLCCVVLTMCCVSFRLVFAHMYLTKEEEKTKNTTKF